MGLGAAIGGLVSGIGKVLPLIGAGATVYSSMQQKNAADDAARMQAEYQKRQQAYAQQQAEFEKETQQLNLQYQQQQKQYQDEQIALQKTLADQQRLDAENARKMQEEMSKKSLELQKEQLAKQLVDIPKQEEDLTPDMVKLNELDKKRRAALSLKKTNTTNGLLKTANIGIKTLLGGVS